MNEFSSEDYDVVFPNQIFKFDENYRLNVLEIYLFAYLHMRRNFHTRSVITNMDILNEELSFVKKKQDNIEKIVSGLMGLKKKRYITFDADTFSEIKKVKLINIVINEDMIDKDIGFIRMKYKTFNHVDGNMLQYAILTFIRYLSWKKRDIPFKEFEEYLVNEKGNNVSDKTIRNEIDKMSKKGLLLVTRGKYFNSNEDFELCRQEANKYSINEDYIKGYSGGEFDIIKKWREVPEEMRLYIDDSDQAQQMFNDLKMIKDLEYKHYKWIMDHWNKEFQRLAIEKRLMKMKNGGFNFSKWEEKYKKDRENESE